MPSPQPKSLPEQQQWLFCCGVGVPGEQGYASACLAAPEAAEQAKVRLRFGAWGKSGVGREVTRQEQSAITGRAHSVF